MNSMLHTTYLFDYKGIRCSKALHTQYSAPRIRNIDINPTLPIYWNGFSSSNIIYCIVQLVA